MKTITILAYIALLMSTAVTYGSVIYDGYGNPTGDFAPEGRWTGWLVNTSLDVVISHKMAVKFTLAPAANDWALESVVLPLGCGYTTINVRISIVQGDADTPVGTTIWSVTNPPEIPADLSNITIAATGSLLQNEAYWLVMEPATSPLDESANSLTYWAFASPSNTILISNAVHGPQLEDSWGDWSLGSPAQAPAFSILGHAIPEPSTFLFSITGMVLMVFRAANRRFHR